MKARLALLAIMGVKWAIRAIGEALVREALESVQEERNQKPLGARVRKPPLVKTNRKES